MTRKAGAPGQFDVVVDGQVVASRGGNVLTRLLGGGWPDPEDVVAKVEALLAAKKANR
ncbi:MAG: hypothetical protein JNK15_21140 [Planctomycetes bacterium]|nr:hypothetical protein [Planctomycetota bacterium]